MPYWIWLGGKKWFQGHGEKRAVMTRRKEMVSGSRKWASQHDPEERNGLRVKEAGKSAWPGGEKRFLGQGKNRIAMTRRRKKISRSRKEPDCHDPEEKTGFWVKERTGLPWPGGENWFLGQGKNQIAMTRRKEMISGSRKQASQHDLEERNDFWIKGRGRWCHNVYMKSLGKEVVTGVKRKIIVRPMQIEERKSIWAG